MPPSPIGKAACRSGRAHSSPPYACREIDDLFNLFDTDASGTLSLEEFIVSGYDVMSDMARERAIMNAMYDANMAAQADIFG